MPRGCGVECILLVRDPQELKFDVRGQRCLSYGRIKELEDKLDAELGGLMASASNTALPQTRRS